jgi:hypothetical protein
MLNGEITRWHSRHQSQTITYLSLDRWAIWCGSGEAEFHRQFQNACSGLSAEEQVVRNEKGAKES